MRANVQAVSNREGESHWLVTVMDTDIRISHLFEQESVAQGIAMILNSAISSHQLLSVSDLINRAALVQATEAMGFR